MKKFVYELTKNEYDFIANSPSKADDYLEHKMPDAIRFGYGYYGYSNLREENGKFFCDISRGDTCD